MKTPYDEVKREAISRLILWNLPSCFINALYDDEICVIEGDAYTYVQPEYMEEISKIEERYNCFVYLVLKNQDSFSFLYITDNKETWNDDWIRIEQNNPMAYVFNSKDKGFSEFGLISTERTADRLVRRIE